MTYEVGSARFIRSNDKMNYARLKHSMLVLIKSCSLLWTLRRQQPLKMRPEEEEGTCQVYRDLIGPFCQKQNQLCSTPDPHQYLGL